MKIFHLATTSAGMEFKQKQRTPLSNNQSQWLRAHQRIGILYLPRVWLTERVAQNVTRNQETATNTIEHLGIKGHPNYY